MSDDSGPAFPACNEAWNNQTLGMTLRDYFAGQALAGLCANLEYIADADMTYGDLSEKAFNQADAMIAARSRHGRPTGEA